MARRGRFGRSETGASDLSATIASLVRQQKQEQEKYLLEAYYSEIPYAGGNVPTLQDVINFYRESASMAGIEEGTEDYQAIFQKINDITNYDIKRQYGNLIEVFNNTEGSNYSQLLDFLGGRAQTSTSQDDLGEYAASLDSTTTAFLRYRGEDLKKRVISPKEYQAITKEALSALDPGSEAYNNAIYDAFSYEWSAQSEIWNNKLKAGLISQSRFVSLARGLADRMLASGIDKNSGLYTGVLASISTVSGGVGSSQTNKRIGNNLGKLASAYLIAASATGIGDNADLMDLQENPDKVLDYIAKNPEIFLAYNEYLIANPDAINLLSAERNQDGQPLIDISSADEFSEWVNRKLDRVQADYAIEGNKDKYLEATRAKRASGSGSVEDEFAFAADKRNNLLAEAKNPFDETYIRNQWRDYVNGVKSKLFGQIPGGDPEVFALQLAKSSPYLVSLYQNEIDAVKGEGLKEGLITLSGRYDNNTGEQNIDNDWNFWIQSESQTYALATGLAAWDPNANDGRGDIMPPARDGFDKGVYQRMTFGTSTDGSLVPFIEAYSGEPLYKNDDAGGEVVGWVYDVDGVTIALNSEGKKIKSPLAKQLGKWIVPDASVTNETVGTIDTSVASTPALLRQAVVNIENGILKTGTLDEQVVNSIRSGITAATTAANLRQAAQLQTLPNLSPQQRARIYQLRGADISQWNKFVMNNTDKYVEAKPGIWVLKPEFAKKEESKGPFQIFDLQNLGISAMPYEKLPTVVDIRTQKEKEEQPTAAEEAQGLSVDPQTGFVFSDPKTTKPSDSSVFFRNMNQFRAGEREQLNIAIPKPAPKPIIPEPPKVQVFTPQQVSRSLIDFRAGERQPLNIPTEPKFTQKEIEQSLIDFRAGERNI